MLHKFIPNAGNTLHIINNPPLIKPSLRLITHFNDVVLITISCNIIN